MNRTYHGLILLFLLVLLGAVSCAGAPPAEEPLAPSESGTVQSPAGEGAAQGPDQAAIDALNAAAARAEAARKMAADFDANSLFPSDWNAADTLFGQAEQLKDSATAQGARDSAFRYNAAADAFEALNSKMIAHYYELAERTLTEARAAAVNAGAETLVPDYLLAADNETSGAYAKYEAKDYYGAKDAALNALSMYDVLTGGLNAYAVRRDIENRGFEVYDPQNIAAGDDTLRSAALSYAAGDYASAADKAASAMAVYTAALKTGWESYAAERGAEAAAERQKALDLKANVAVKQNFDFAQIAYGQANAAFAREDFEEAAGRYINCRSIFAEIAASALEKRLAAEEALRIAAQRMAESDETAKNAELVLEGGGE